MLIHDNLIRKLFWKDNSTTKLYRKFNQSHKRYPNVLNYLTNRFADSLSIYESVLRICLNVIERPKCPICGNDVTFIGKPNSKGLFRKTCSHRCSCLLTNNFNCHIEESQERARQTKLHKYGSETYNNRDKARQTCKERYGVDVPLKNMQFQEKSKQVKLQKYGDKNYNNWAQTRLTKLERYGNPTFVNPEKAKQTCMEKYGEDFYKEHGQNVRQIIIEKYGEDAWRAFATKGQETKETKYGDKKYNNYDKAKETCLEKYGVTSYSQSISFKENVDWESAVSKQIETKRKNNTFNKSNIEDASYILLKEKYTDVIRQYKSAVYPFACDFYIPSLDLYIECNYHWTHNTHLYDPNNENDVKIVTEWKNKNTKYYDGAIYTWTQLDVRKYNTAKENNLNYLVFYDINELKTWLNKKSNA